MSRPHPPDAASISAVSRPHPAMSSACQPALSRRVPPEPARRTCQYEKLVGCRDVRSCATCSPRAVTPPHPHPPPPPRMARRGRPAPQGWRHCRRRRRARCSGGACRPAPAYGFAYMYGCTYGKPYAYRARDARRPARTTPTGCPPHPRSRAPALIRIRMLPLWNTATPYAARSQRCSRGQQHSHNHSARSMRITILPLYDTASATREHSQNWLVAVGARAHTAPRACTMSCCHCGAQ